MDGKYISPWQFVQIRENNDIILNGNSISFGNSVISWGDNIGERNTFFANSKNGIKDVKNGEFSYNNEAEKSTNWLSFGSVEDI